MNKIKTGFEGLHRRYDTGIFRKEKILGDVDVWIQEPPIVTSEAGVIIALWKRVGAWRDPAGKEGLAHFFEHIPFTGTRDFPDRDKLFHTINEMGGAMNAATGVIMTNYYVVSPKNTFQEAVHIVSELALRPLVREEDIDKERGIILSEYRRRYSNNDIYTSEKIEQAFWKEHPLGKRAIGTPEGIGSVYAEDMREFQKNYYQSGNLVLFVGGAFSERKDILEIGSKEFEDVVRGPESPSWPPMPFNNSDEILLEGEEYLRSQIYMRWMFPVGNTADALRQSYIASTLSRALTEDRDSPLPSIIREKMGLAYETKYSFGGADSDSIDFGGIIKVPFKDLNVVQGVFMDCLKKLNADEIVKNIRRAQVARAMNYTDSVNAVHNAVDDVLDYGRPISYWEAESMRDAISPDEVLALRDRVLAVKPWICRVHGKN